MSSDDRDRERDGDQLPEVQEDLDRIPSHPPMPEGYGTQEPQRFILMSPHMAAIGGLLAFFTVVLMVVILPTSTYNPPASDNWLPLSDAAVRGRAVYVANGCVYCHSGFVRPQDFEVGQYYLYPRVAEPGDYYGPDQAPNLLGSERTGPDLSEEGGMHPDDWHMAHYDNPRNVQPLSIMPVFSFFADSELKDMIAFNQESGGKDATLRKAAQMVAKNLMMINGSGKDPAELFPDLVNQLTASGDYHANGSAMDKSPEGMPWMAVWMLNSFERSYWLTADPLPVTQQNLLRGKELYVQRCSGCHGVHGDGIGPATDFLMPAPFDFTDDGSPVGINGIFASDGALYHRILSAGKGTAMENFATRLSLQDTWRIVLFLRTIQNGSLAEPGTVPTVDMYKPYTAPMPLMKYIDAHPIDKGPGVITDAATDPFSAAAHWIAPGLADGETVYVGGKLPVSPARLTEMVRSMYMDLVNQAYSDAVNRGEQGLPSKDQILSTDSLEWHEPS
jgi:cytochrome c oxidase cbb3-type subunit 2